MISGPIPPHPRVLLKDLWLEPELNGSAGVPGFSKSEPDKSGEVSDPERPPSSSPASPSPAPGTSPQTLLDPQVFQLESGWTLLSSELCFGKGLEVDFMGMDANRAPIAILALNEQEQDHCPLRMLDLKAWFQRNKELIRQTWMRVCPELVALDLHRELRFFLIAHDFSPNFLERLSGLSSFDLRVFRLRSLGVRGRHFWYAEGVAPWTSCAGESSPFQAPSGVETQALRENINALLSRIRVVGEGLVGGGLAFEGGRFDRRVLVGNELVLELGVVQEDAWVRIPGYADEFSLGGPEEQARILDCFLRSLMGRSVPLDGSPMGSNTQRPSLGGVRMGALPEVPAGGSDLLSAPGTPRSVSQSPLQSPPQSTQRTNTNKNPGRSSPPEGSYQDSGRRDPLPLDRGGGPRLSDEEMAAFFGT